MGVHLFILSTVPLANVESNAVKHTRTPLTPTDRHYFTEVVQFKLVVINADAFRNQAGR